MISMIWCSHAITSVKFSCLIVLGFIAGLAIGCSRPPARYSEPESSEAADRAAAASLATFRKLITDQNFRHMGFDSLEEVKNAALDNSIKEYEIDLNSLKKYRTGDDPEEFLLPAHSLVYPVLVNGRVRTSITLGYRDNAWKAQAYGRSNLMKIIANQREDLSKNQQLIRSAFFIVRVPALNLAFLGYRVNRTLMFSPILDSPGYGFAAGIPMPSDFVLQRLRSAARDYDDLPH